MTLSSYVRRKVGLVGAVMAGVFLLASGQALGLTSAGEVITNQATVSYQDDVGNTLGATSNQASVTVAEVYAATLRQDRSREGAPGQQVYFQHFLQNTGNASDTYTITTFADTARNGASDDGADDSDYFVYRDTNGNGEPNAGEPIILDPANASGSITLAQDETANLLVAFGIPGAALDGDTFGLTIQVTSTNLVVPITNVDGRVNDLTTGEGNDGLEGTNNDLATARTGAVLSLVKDATYEVNGTPNDPSDDTVLYSLFVTNTGGSAATFVDIIDPIPGDTQFREIVAVSGLLAANGDTALTQNTDPGTNPDLTALPTDLTTILAAPLDETDAGRDPTHTAGVPVAQSLDINDDGNTTGTGITAIYFRDAELRPNTTVRIDYRVDVDDGLAAGTAIVNAFIADNTDSGEITVNVPQAYALIARDTGANPADDVNDGGDDDTTLNDVAFVNRAQDGDVVRFTNVIRNNGNGPDTFELSVLNDGGVGADVTPAALCSGTAFPAGTSFEFYNGADTALLGNSNSLFGRDTGELQAGDEVTITVRAVLPPNSAGAGDYCATLTARSFGAGTTSPVTDTKIERLGAIVAPILDLANADYVISGVDAATLPQVFVNGTSTVTSPAASPNPTTVNTEVVGFNDGGVVDTHPVSGIATVTEVGAGTVFELELFIANEGLIEDSYNLGFANVPTGWDVVFVRRGIDADGDGTLDSTTDAGTEITNSPSIPAGGVFQYSAQITVSATPAQALADSGSGTDANGDGDDDYVITFTAQSGRTSASVDSKRDAIDIARAPALLVDENLANQVQPGGSVSYADALENTGNVVLNVTLTVTHSEAGFDNTTLVDTDGDGVGDVEIENLVAGTVNIDDGSGNVQSIAIAIDSGNPVFTLAPGQRIPLDVTVQAPSSANANDRDFFDIFGTDASESIAETARNTTTVVTVQVRLFKSVAVDTSCSCDPTALTFPVTTGADVAATADVEPNQCVVWELIAANQSTQDARNVVINDQVTDFTTYESDSLHYCKGAGCTPASVTDIADAPVPDAGLVSGDDVSFTVGDLDGGDQAVGYFCVRVD